MAFIDYYKIMGINKDTPQKDIRAAYKRRAKQFHPDLHPDDPKAKAKFQALNEAYDVLGDPEKRKKYDQYGENWKQAEAFEGAGGAWANGAGTARRTSCATCGHRQSAQGGAVILQPHGGNLKLRVKPETQNGTKVRLRGKGFERRDGSYGDIIITYNVKLPTHLSERQKELLMEMKNA